jgi:hypothetical protein
LTCGPLVSSPTAPADPSWLSAAERSALQKSLAEDEDDHHAHGPSGFLVARADRKLIHFIAICFLIQMSLCA